ncbi:MAG: phosphodiester glycosidase family protein, partial [Candidatus Shapirobacteria bacterium]|nr:phosphodiester glycosidase family protein [Candidatus Shapirobacteria bacterium]
NPTLTQTPTIRPTGTPIPTINPTLTPTIKPTITLIPTPTPTSVWDKETYDPIEGKNAKYKTITDSLKIWISKPTGYTLTRIWAKDPYKQFHTYNSDDYKKSSDIYINIFNHAISSNANGLKNKAAVAFNEMVSYKYSGRSSGFRKYSKIGLIIHEGKVLRNDPTSKKYIRSDICWIDKNSTLHNIDDIMYNSERTPARTETIVKSYNEATISGALTTVEGKKIVSNGKNIYKRRKSSYAAVIQGFCQINKNNFLYVTTNSGWWGEELANTLIKLGCKEAYHFDGGGSTNVFFKKPTDSKWTAVRGTKDPKYSRGPSWSISYWTEL